MSKIAVGMSGGVDSSVAAALLIEEGHEVIGLSMKIWPGDTSAESSQRHSCYGPSEEEDLRDAQAVASRLGIPFYILDLKREYKTEVLDYFRSEYLYGRTPNPCVRCNRRVKFDALVEKARNSGLDFQHFATGHYAQTERSESNGRYILKKAKQEKKDQSYFLFSLSQTQLSDCLFPLGGCTKNEVRSIAHSRGLMTHSKTESQDFFHENYTSLLGGGTNPGPILDTQGNILGQHRGIGFYTIGQRRGIGLPAREPLYVIAIDHRRNAIVVGHKSDVYGKQLTASDLNWIAIDNLDRPITVTAKIRYSHEPAEAVVSPLDKNRVHVHFSKPQMAITPGQAIVFYDGDIVIGGGLIEIAGGQDDIRPQDTD
jgi:tRNA-specific 2-thiouridylase